MSPGERRPVVLGADDSGLDAAAELLAAGLVVAVPTDTVYGVAVACAAAGATARLFAAKRRPRGVDLPVLVASPADAFAVGAFGDDARDLAERHWPGALTVVVARRGLRDVDLGDSVDTVGLRCPDAHLVRALAARVGPVATTSANLHGRPPLTTAAGVVATFTADEVAAVVDGGPCDGVPSTVVDCTGPTPSVLRQGAVTI